MPPFEDKSILNHLYVLRHGHSEANELGLIVSDPNNGVSQYGLTPKGREQVLRSIETFARSLTRKTSGVIFSSPFLRATETADIAEEKLSWPVQVSVDLRERGFGEFELSQDIHYARVWDQDRIDPNHTQWGVESVIEVCRRLEDCLRQISMSHTREIVLLVTHGDPASILLRSLRDIGLQSHHCVCEAKTGQLIKVIE